MCFIKTNEILSRTSISNNCLISRLILTIEEYIIFITVTSVYIYECV